MMLGNLGLIGLGLIIVFTVVPAIFLLYKFYKADKYKPEPVNMIVKVFLLGTLSIAVTLAFGMFLGDIDAVAYNMSPWLGYLVMSFVTAALIEETAKFIIFKLVVYKNPLFDELMDGIVYMVTISLSFAAIENVLYGITTNGDLMVIGMRAVTAVPLHAICSGIMGYYIGMEKINRKNGASFKGLFLAILIHGGYNFFAFASADSAVLGFGVFGVVIVCGLILKTLIDKALAEDKAMGRTTTAITFDDINKYK